MIASNSERCLEHVQFGSGRKIINSEMGFNGSQLDF
jgi:hypothetical protein